MYFFGQYQAIERPRKLDITHDQFDCCSAFDESKRFIRPGCRNDVVPRFLQAKLQKAQHKRLVFDDKNLHGRLRGCAYSSTGTSGKSSVLIAIKTNRILILS